MICCCLVFCVKCSESEVNSFDESKSDKSKWEPDWVPQIVFMNSNGGLEIFEPTERCEIFKPDDDNTLNKNKWGMGEKHLGFDPSKGHWIHGTKHGDLILTEEMELQAFPLDCQDLTICMSSIIDAEKCLFFSFFSFFYYYYYLKYTL